MQIGLSSYTYPWTLGLAGHDPDPHFTVHTLIDEAAFLGAAVVQLADLPAVENATDEKLASFRAHADRVGIQLEVGIRGLRKKEMDRAFTTASILGATLIRTVIDRGDDQPPLDEVAVMLQGWEPELQSRGIRLAIENHDRIPAQDLAQLFKQLSTPWIGSCIDTVNSLAVPEDPVTVMNALAPFAFSIHAKDFAVRRVNSDLGFSVSGRTLGQGDLDIGKLIHLVEGGREADISIIVESWLPAQARPTESWALEREWARSGVEHLKQVLRDKPEEILDLLVSLPKP